MDDGLRDVVRQETAAARHAATANRDRYADGSEVESYLREPFHRVRLAEAIHLLTMHCTTPDAHRPGIADLGAGTGDMSGQLTAAGFQVFPCDVEGTALRAARHASPGLSVVRMDATEPFPFRSSSLDGVFIGELIEHLFDPGKLLRECHRVLRPGGVLVLTTPNLATLQDRLRFLSGRAPRQVNPYHEYLRLHIRPFTYSALAASLRREGLVPVALRSNFIHWYSRTRKYHSRIGARCLPKLGASLIVAAVRP